MQCEKKKHTGFQLRFNCIANVSINKYHKKKKKNTAPPPILNKQENMVTFPDVSGCHGILVCLTYSFIQGNNLQGIYSHYSVK